MFKSLRSVKGRQEWNQVRTVELMIFGGREFEFQGLKEQVLCQLRIN